MFKSFQPKLLCPVYEKYEAAKGRDRLAAACREKVTQWRWATGDMALREPFHKEKYRHNPQWLKAGAKGNVEFGLTDPMLKNHCRLHAQLMSLKDDLSSGMKALRAVAKQLNGFDWSQTIAVTPDFVVAAVDNTGEVDFIKDIKAVVPAALFRSLKKKGLV